MTIPAAMFIEAAHDELLKETSDSKAAKVKELEEAAWLEAQSPQFVEGYLLGIATTEVMLEMRGQKL